MRLQAVKPKCLRGTQDPACSPPPAEDGFVHGSALVWGGGPESQSPLIAKKIHVLPPGPTMACEPRFVLGLEGKGWMNMAFGRGCLRGGSGVRRTPSFLGEREGQGAGFPEIWGVSPLLKPPSPATPPLSWNPVPRGGGKDRPFRERQEEGRAGSPKAWVPAGGGGFNGRGSGLRSVRGEEDGSVRSSNGSWCRVE